MVGTSVFGDCLSLPKPASPFELIVGFLHVTVTLTKSLTALAPGFPGLGPGPMVPWES